MHIKKKKRVKRITMALSLISPSTIRLLNTVLPFLLCAFLWFGGAYIAASLRDPVYAEYAFRPVSDNLLISLLLLIGGAAILDCSIARGDFDK